MPVKVDLKAKPYYLSDKDIDWVENTIKNMTDKEMIGQLFFHLFLDFNEENVREKLSKYHLGGARYHLANSEEVFRFTEKLQKYSKIPIFVACNCDNGGDGAVKDGTYIASGAQCEASNSEKVSYNAGLVSGREATAVGCNWNFDPCSDIVLNWRNTIVNTRSYGKDADTVLKHIRSYVKGLNESKIISTIKHFPGDGTEERDQHLVLGVNELSEDEWDATFGKVFKTMIDDGIMTIMAGHIALPKYSKKLIPEITYDKIMPATLAPELINGLLKDKLGFNGLVITDASHMLGISASMRREDYVPRTIASGCDMFLFFNDIDEDFEYMMNGYRKGIITEERLHDALRRILGLKAAIKLHESKEEKKLFQIKESLNIIGCAEHKKMAAEAADLGITLVKNTLNQLPIKPEINKRIVLYVLSNEENNFFNNEKNQTEKIIIEELEKVGFEVTLNKRGVREKGKISEYKKKYDAAFLFSDIRGYATENNYRIRWSCAMSNEIPWFVWEIPTVFVSLNFTTHLTDVPMVKTYINSYNNTREIISQTIQKIIGNSKFKGKFNENVWCNKWESKR